MVGRVGAQVHAVISLSTARVVPALTHHTVLAAVRGRWKQNKVNSDIPRWTSWAFDKFEMLTIAELQTLQRI